MTSLANKGEPYAFFRSIEMALGIVVACGISYVPKLVPVAETEERS